MLLRYKTYKFINQIYLIIAKFIYFIGFSKSASERVEPFLNSFIPIFQFKILTIFKATQLPIYILVPSHKLKSILNNTLALFNLFQ